MRVEPKIAYCMNLDKRPDRWAQVVADFEPLKAALGTVLVRVPAVENIVVPQAGTFATFKGIIGAAKERGDEHVLVVEDDLCFIDVRKVVDALGNCPDDWDILLGGSYHYVPEKAYNDHWMKMRDFCSLHFVIVRRTMFDTILEAVTGKQHADRFLSQACAGGRHGVYLMHPMPCQQRAGYSDLRQRKVDDNRRNGLPWLQKS